jgi:hypothetical protein
MRHDIEGRVAHGSTRGRVEVRRRSIARSHVVWMGKRQFVRGKFVRSERTTLIVPRMLFVA